ncbi:MAG: rRNA pseudouridine synthase [Bdellovibrionales bacterium]|nr:rRNA pseudouridine synthase [Oligoflexia bacterium]
MAKERAQKIIAQSGLMSRRAAEVAIAGGRVAVNGAVFTEMGRLVDSELESLTVDGNLLFKIETKRTYLFYKPRGVMTTKVDPEGRPTVMDYFKDDLALNPVGRLDFESEGLLLLTHDGELLLKLTHPRYGVEKVYEVSCEGKGRMGYLREFLRGIELSDGMGKFVACEVIEPNTQFLITVSEGRNRFVRRMFGEVGFAVTRLKRVRMGTYELGDLKPGDRREVK